MLVRAKNIIEDSNATRPRKPHGESVLVYLYLYSHMVSLQLIVCIYFLLLSVVNSSSKEDFNNWWYSIKSNPFVPITSAAAAEDNTKNHFYFLTHTLLQAHL